MEDLFSQYKVKINWTSKTGRKLSMKFFFAAFVIFCIWYVVDFPVRYLPRELSIPYYLDFLPRWLLNTFGIGIGLAIISFVLFDIRLNTSGQLKLYKDRVIIESMKRSDVIRYNELKRITFVVNLFSINPYRIEFIYPDFKVKRVKVNKDKFYRIMDELNEITPEGFEIDVNSFETTGNITK
jgi:hypothetical protein